MIVVYRNNSTCAAVNRVKQKVRDRQHKEYIRAAVTEDWTYVYSVHTGQNSYQCRLCVLTE